MGSCAVDDFERELSAIIQAYAEEVKDTLALDMEQAGLYAEEQVRREAPGSGNYSGGWQMRTEHDANDSISVTVGNVTGGRRKGTRKKTKKPIKYPTNITSLLEKGHMKRGGGWVAARPHIDPAYEYAVAYLKARLGIV